MRKTAYALYAIASYGLFFVTFLYMIGFVGNYLVPESIDIAGSMAFGLSAPQAALWNLGLIALFGVQHSVMARPGFKAWWTRIVPEAIERATYVLASSVILVVTFWLWQPINLIIWDATSTMAFGALTGAYFLGWTIVFASTFIINHFDLFGLKQVYDHITNRTAPAPSFQVRWLYKLVRHPLMVGWLFVVWATPMMTLGHVLFAAANTAYILIALRYEERDLVDTFGDEYRDYQREVPKLIPLAKAKPAFNEKKARSLPAASRA